MLFHQHLDLEGKHAELSASKYAWLRYSKEKFHEVFENASAIKKGTELHKIARDLIANDIRLPRSNQTLNMYVNDAIGYGMAPEVILKPLPFSNVAFGTADAISFTERSKLLRIHDLKTGESPACMDQLKIYAAFFVMEYGDSIGIKEDPSLIDIELRIYQSDHIVTCKPEPDEIKFIINQTKIGVEAHDAWVADSKGIFR